MKIAQMSSGERPREKMMQSGAKSLSDADLIAILLRTGTPSESVLDISRKLLADCEGYLTELSARSIENLASVKGIGQTKAITLCAAFELGRRMGEEKFRHRKKAIGQARDIYEIFGPALKGASREECWVAFLNRAQYLIGKERISQGDDISTIFNVGMIVRRSVERQARKIVIVHNHPSGNPVPGKADLTETQKLKEALGPFNIRLLDHVVICDDCFYSFCDERIYPAR